MKQFLHILSYPMSAIFYVFFGIFLLLFDPIQRICLGLFGYSAHKNSVDLFNLLIIRSLHIIGIRFDIVREAGIPTGKPLIIVSNHQSMWDIPPLIWFLRKHHPKFISKKELGKNIPTISYNLKHGGSVLIDRKDPVQATEQIANAGRYISEYGRGIVIFPEGTRSRDGNPKSFKKKGLETLFKNAPEALVLPVSISNSWQLQRFGMFPIPLFVRLRLVFHPVMQIPASSHDNFIDQIEDTIKAAIL